MTVFSLLLPDKIACMDMGNHFPENQNIEFRTENLHQMFTSFTAEEYDPEKPKRNMVKYERQFRKICQNFCNRGDTILHHGGLHTDLNQCNQGSLANYSLSYSENFHFSNFQPPASEAANKFEK